MQTQNSQSRLKEFRGCWMNAICSQQPATYYIVPKVVFHHNWKSEENPKMKMKTVNFPLKVAKHKSNYVVSSLFFSNVRVKALEHFECFCLYSMPFAYMCLCERKKTPFVMLWWFNLCKICSSNWLTSLAPLQIQRERKKETEK